MKRIVTLLTAVIFIFALALSAMAASYTVDGDGNAVYDTAVGYTFHVDSVNGKISGEDSTVLTSAAGLDNCGEWAIWFVADKVSDNVYKAATDGAAMGGSKPSVKLKDDQVIFVFHSATSNPDQASSYPNWEDKVAALAVKNGNFLALTGVDLAAGTVSEGKLTVTAKQSEAENLVGSSTPATTSETEDESSEEVIEASSEDVVDESSESTPAESSATTADESATASESSTATATSEDSEVKTSEIEPESNFPWGWVIAAIAVVVIVACVVVFSKKKK